MYNSARNRCLQISAIFFGRLGIYLFSYKRCFPEIFLNFKTYGGNMLFKSKFFHFVCALCLVLSMTVLAFGDTIRLKDGSIIKGKIVNFNGGKFTVVIEDGTRQRQMNFAADEVESIMFDSGSMPADMPSNQTNTGNNNTNSTIITVGQTNKTTNPQTTAPKTSQAETINQPSGASNTATSTPKPIEINVKVLADNTSNGWTNSGWVVRKGQKIRISGGGRVSLGKGRSTTPDGISSLPDNNKLMPNEKTGGLIAVIGDDNNAFIFIGSSREFTATRDGALFLGVNEGNLDDNTGAFDIKIEIFPDTDN